VDSTAVQGAFFGREPEETVDLRHGDVAEMALDEHLYRHGSELAASGDCELPVHAFMSTTRGRIESAIQAGGT
jgi:hypothetical protein